MTAGVGAEEEEGVSDLTTRYHDFPDDKRDTPLPTPNKKEIFSSKPHLMDYVTTEGIIQRTGHTDKADWYLLMLKESLDNATDFLHKEYPYSDNTAVDVEIILDDAKGGLFNYKVRNTNSRNIPVFKDLRDNLDFHKTFGSKQNKHIISRGQLGDALKQLAAFGYTLMHEQYDKSADAAASFGAAQWTEHPMIIRANGKEHRITIKVDDINSDIKTNVDDTMPSPSPLSSPTSTEIENTCPLLQELRKPLIFDSRRCKLDWVTFVLYLRGYSIFTTDISFSFKIIDDDKVEAITAPRLHSISPKWNNKSSVFYYTPKEFRNTVVGVHFKQDTTLYDLLQDRFREATLMKKTPDLDLTISQFLEQAEGNEETLERNLESLYRRLREVDIVTKKGEVKRVEPPTELSLPYSHVSDKARKIHLANRMVQFASTKGLLDPSRAAYKIVHGKAKSYVGKYEIRYPFAFEVIAVPISKHQLLANPNRSSLFHGAVNYSISPQSNDFKGNYEWDKKEKDGTVHRVELFHQSIESVFEACGLPFHGDRTSFSKVPCYIAANLISPKVSYQGKDKSAIDIAPFADKIIEAVEAVIADIPTFTGVGITLVREKKKSSFSTASKTSKFSDTKIPTNHQIIDEVIGDDCKKVQSAKAQGRKTRIHRERTQNSIWYNGLPRWKAHLVPTDQIPGRRGYISEISEVCADYGLKREEVGIVASPWAQMYFQGGWYAVTFDGIEELSKKGTDIIFIEKQDIVAALGPYASRVGVALVNTRGHLVEYAKELARLATRKEGEEGGTLGWKKVGPAVKETARGNIAILTDYDTHGLLIASKLKNAIFLGVDERMLRHFRISHESEGVVDYDPKKKLTQDTIDEILADERFSDIRVVDIDFLKKNKVEIDAVLAHLNDRAGPIWNYIQNLLEEAYRDRNYLRVINKRPDSLSEYYHPMIKKFMAYVNNLATEATEKEATKIEKELENVQGFLVVNDKKKERNDRLVEKIKKNAKLRKLAAALKKFDKDNGLGISRAEIPCLPPDHGGEGVSNSEGISHDISVDENDTLPPPPALAAAATDDDNDADTDQIPNPPIDDLDIELARQAGVSLLNFVNLRVIIENSSKTFHEKLREKFKEAESDAHHVIVDEAYKQVMRQLGQRSSFKDGKGLSPVQIERAKARLRQEKKENKQEEGGEEEDYYLMHGKLALAEAAKEAKKTARDYAKLSNKEKLKELQADKLGYEERLHELTHAKEHYVSIGSKSSNPTDHIWYLEERLEDTNAELQKLQDKGVDIYKDEGGEE